MEPPLTPVPVNGTNGNHDGLLEPTTQFDISLFQSYLSALLPPVVGALPEELDDLFESSDFHETVSKFAAEGSDVIYVVKRRVDLEGSVFCEIFSVTSCVIDLNFDVGIGLQTKECRLSRINLLRNSLTILQT